MWNRNLCSKAWNYALCRILHAMLEPNRKKFFFWSETSKHQGGITLSLKHIFFSIIFVFFSIYIAFLNPHESIFYLTQSQTIKLPMVVLLLAAVFTGVLLSIAIFWTSILKNSFLRWRSTVEKSRSEKKRGRIES